MNKEISEDLFNRILNAIDKLNREQYEAMENGDTVKVKEINKKISRRLNLLIVPNSAYRSNK